MKINAAQRLLATEWPAVGAYGLEGKYSTTFVGSPGTAEKFVQYLKAHGAKQVNTGKRGREYLIAWDAPFVDVQDWKRKGFPTASVVKAGTETGEGAGALLYCPESEQFLILLRSDDHTWCGLGGGRDYINGVPEDLETTVRREAFEEAGLDMDVPVQLIHVDTIHHADGFKFHNYLGIIQEEFLPMINDEHRSFQWAQWDNFPQEMHPKMMEAFNSPSGQRVLQQHTTALDHGGSGASFYD